MQLKHLEDIKLVAVDDVCYHVRGRRIKKSKKELTSVEAVSNCSYIFCNKWVIIRPDMVLMEDFLQFAIVSFWKICSLSGS